MNSKDSTFKDDFIKSLYYVWIIFSIIILCIIISTFLIPKEFFEITIPTCEWIIKYNKTCPLCGMTRAFFDISRFELNKAYNLNIFSIPLYLLFLLNTIFFIYKYVKKIWR